MNYTLLLGQRYVNESYRIVSVYISDMYPTNTESRICGNLAVFTETFTTFELLGFALAYLDLQSHKNNNFLEKTKEFIRRSL